MPATPVSASVQRLEDRTLLAAPNPLELSSLNGTNGFRLDGVAAFDGSGSSVSSAGDVNGDGFEDLIIGARSASPNTISYAGSSYVVFGKSGGFAAAINLSTLNGTTGFRLDGVAASDAAGGSVSGAGDVNGDGFDDLIVGALGADPNSNSSAGSSYVVFGKSGAFAAAINLSTLNGTTGFRLDGVAADDRSGKWVSSAGDVNGDGLYDLVIGAEDADPNGTYSGSSYVLFGQSDGFASVIDLSSLDGTTGFRLDGVAAYDRSGRSVSGAGDVNGDGFDDLFTGARYVVFGASGGFASAINLSSLDGTNGFRLDSSSTSGSSAGDVNGDGFDDLIVGANFADPNGNAEAGSSYVLFGRSGGFASAIDLSSLNRFNGFRLDGVAVGDSSGYSVSSAGDVNGDGFDDLIVGALYADPNGNFSAGSSYVFFGRAMIPASVINLSTLNGATGFRLDGEAADDKAGRRVSSAGDINGDGFDDFIVGASGADPNGNPLAGSSYVVLGGNFSGGAETQVGGNGADLLAAQQGPLLVDVLVGGRGDDTLVSDGGPDVLRGGEGDDLLILPDLDFGGTRRVEGGTGIDTLRLDVVGQIFNLTNIADNRITGVEEIDLNGGGNRLIITPGELVRLSPSSNTLRVRGSGTDRVTLTEEAWTFNGIVNLDGTDYRQYLQDAATLNIQSGITTTFGAVSLSSLNGMTGFRIDGFAADDRAGHSVSGAGDVNGDGFGDVIVGAFVADPNGQLGIFSAGSSYVVFGNSGGFQATINVTTLNGTNGFRLDGVASYDNSGFAVSDVGDVNGDGLNDLVIGARGADPGGNADAGSSYVLFGKSDGFASAINLSSLNGSTGFRIDGVAAGDFSGFSVSAAGDVNGDGLGDVVIGAYRADPNGSSSGSSYVVFGRSGGNHSVIDLSALNGTNGFRLDGTTMLDRSGFSVGGAGDVNGDGYDDVIVGAYAADPNGGNSGSSYVVFGRSGGFGPVQALSALDGTTGFRLDGVAANDKSGRSVSGAGDVNGDGFDDLIVGASDADPNDNASGSSYVVYGHSGPFGSTINLSSLNGTTGFRLDGVAAVDFLGRGVSAAGDVNGDGFDDLIVGGYQADRGGSDSGSSYVFFGRPADLISAIDLWTLDGMTGFRLQGVAAGDWSGRAVSGAGDVNGDGFDDLIVGAYRTDNSSTNSGSGYVVFGGDFAETAVTQLGSDGGQILNATLASGADVLNGGRGDDTLVSDGGPDVLRGGEGDDVLEIPDVDFTGTRRIVGGTGTDLLALTGSGMTLDLTAISDNRLLDIEEIDIHGHGANELVLSRREVVRLSGSTNTLTILGGADDAVSMTSEYWAPWEFQGTSNLGGTDFEQYTSGAATLHIQTGIMTTVMTLPVNVLPLSVLNGIIGFRLDGAATSDASGVSVSGAGDVNGDGFDDLLVGAFGADPNGNDSGAAYVVFGRSGGFASAVNLGTLNGTNGFRLEGVAAGDQLGVDVGTAGDVNGDGLGDLIVGARQADPNGTDSGATYVLFGRTIGFPASIHLSTLNGTTGFRLDGVTTDDLSGNPVSGAGDLNADGYDDLVVSAFQADPNGNQDSGSSYVVFGHSAGFVSVLDLSALDGTTGFRLDGVAPDDLSGFALSRAGDVNGDGINDLVLGAWKADPNGQTDAGASYVLFGQTGAFASAISLSALNGTNGFRLDGAVAVDHSGLAVSGAGDVNGDGVDDLLIGARSADPNGLASAGSSYVVFGQTGGFASVVDLSSLNALSGFRLDGAATSDQSGRAVSGAGDFNGDGFDDLIIGAPLADFAGNASGSSYVVFGRSSGAGPAMRLSLLSNGLDGLRLDGLLAGDFSGLAVSGAGDVNGDGFDDLIIGALYADVNGTSSGSSYVIFGGDFADDAVTQFGGDGAQILNASLGAGVDVLVGGRGDDTLISDGGDDVLRGGEGDDILAIPDTNFSPRRLQGGNGIDTLRLDGAGLTLDLTMIADNRITDVEVIDVRGSGANVLTLNVQELLSLSSHSNSLIVRTDVDDAVNFGDGWSQQADEMIDGASFFVFTQGAATLKIQDPDPFQVSGRTINGDGSNRSGIGTLALAFNVPANVAGVTTLTLFNHTTVQPVDLSTASLGGDGSPVVTWDLNGLTLPDGRYTAELIRSQVNTTVGGPLAQAFAFEFHVLGGDLDGDAVVNFDDTVPLSLNFGQSGSHYRDGDGDGDGTVNFNDTVPLSLNFGASLAPLTYDFGDAPETGTSFPTTLANDGARHVITGNTLFLGADRDDESDGQPDATATGDGADENGLAFDPLLRGTNVNVTVTSSGAGFVNSWVDFNHDGDWDDPGEQVFTDAAVVAEANHLQITIPAGATLGSTFARFRLTGSAGYSYFGLAPNGEVEDYQLTIIAPAPDLPESVADESLRTADRSNPATPTSNTLPDWLLSVLNPTFTTDDSELSLFSTGQVPRSRRR